MDEDGVASDRCFHYDMIDSEGEPKMIYENEASTKTYRPILSKVTQL